MHDCKNNLKIVHDKDHLTIWECQQCNKWFDNLLAEE